MFKNKVFLYFLVICLALILFVLSIGLFASSYLGTDTILFYGVKAIIAFFILLAAIVAGNLLVNAIKQSRNDSAVNKDFAEELERATRRTKKDFEKLIEALDKKTLYYLPWYIIIGESSSGKSTFLRNANLHFKFQLKKENNDSQTENYNLIISDKAVFIDIAGKYFNPNTSKTADEKKLEILLSNIVKHRPRCPVNGIIFVLPSKHLSDYNNNQSYLEQRDKFLSVLEDMTEKFMVNLPIFLVVTKLDLLKGFSEFCKDNLVVEPKQIVGWDVLDEEKNKKGVLPDDNEKFHLEYNSKFKEVHDALVDASLRKNTSAHIFKDILFFPNYFSNIKDGLKFYIEHLFTNKEKQKNEEKNYFSNIIDRLKFYIKHLFTNKEKQENEEKNWKLAGCYFTSSIQNNETPYSKDLRSKNKELAKIIETSTPYFTEKLVKEKIVGGHYLVTPIDKYHKKLKIYNILTVGFSVFLCIVFISLMIFSGGKFVSHITSTNAKIQRIQDHLNDKDVLTRSVYESLNNDFIEIKESISEKHWFSHWLFMTHSKLTDKIAQIHDAFKIKKMYRHVINGTKPLMLLPISDKPTKDQYVSEMQDYIMIMFKKHIQNCDNACDYKNLPKIFNELEIYWKNKSFVKINKLNDALSKMKFSYEKICTELASRRLNKENIRQYLEHEGMIDNLSTNETQLKKMNVECNLDYLKLESALPKDNNFSFVNKNFCDDNYNDSKILLRKIEKNYDSLLNNQSDRKCISKIFNWLLTQEDDNSISERLLNISNRKEMISICDELKKLPHKLPDNLCSKPISVTFLGCRNIEKLINAYLAFQSSNKTKIVFREAIIKTWEELKKQWRSRLIDKYPFREFKWSSAKGNLRIISGHTHSNEMLNDFFYSDNGFVLLNKIIGFNKVAKLCGVENQFSKEFLKFMKACNDWMYFLYISKDKTRTHKISVILHQFCKLSFDKYQEGINCYSEIKINGHKGMLRYKTQYDPIDLSWSVDKELNNFAITAIDDANREINYSLEFGSTNQNMDFLAFIYRYGKPDKEKKSLKVPFLLPYKENKCRVCMTLTWDDILPSFATRGIIVWPKNSPLIEE